jgi:hypothetical protein
LNEPALETCEGSRAFQVKNRIARKILPLAECLDEMSGMALQNRGATICWHIKKKYPDSVSVNMGPPGGLMGYQVVHVENGGKKVSLDGQNWISPDDRSIAYAIFQALFR